MKSYTSHETFLTDFKMTLNLIKWGLLVSFLLQCLIVGFAIFKSYNYLISKDISQNTILRYGLSYAFPKVKPELQYQKIFGGKEWVTTENYRTFLNIYYRKAFKYAINYTKDTIKISFLCYILAILYISFFIYRSRKMAEANFVRGTVLLPIKTLNKKLRKKASKEDIERMGERSG